MRFIDVQQEATGFIAIGQIATGVFAFGQMATGFVAVGQVAVGVFAFGQGAVGILSIGMGTVGIYWSAAMIGIGGRGFGGVLPLAPSLGPPADLPDTVAWNDAVDDTWIDSALRSGRLQLPEQVRIRASLRHAIEEGRDSSVVAHLVQGAVGLEVDRVIQIRPARYKQLRWWGVWVTQVAMFIGLCAAYTGGFVIPWLRVLWMAP